ncbi:MAG: amino acid adenylation domain-containing protein [Acidobacteriia bacterium]|nr:amino acid adenylation domain-containing protein [Terriglobia bacterium]
MKRSVEVIVGLMGILKAGGAYMALDPGFPEERLRYMAEDAGIRMVVTEHALAPVLRGTGARLIYMDGEEERASIAQESPRNPELTVAMENLLYVIYTSGSTGKSKGVGIEHRQLVNYVPGMLREFQKRGMGVGAKYVMVSTLSADVGNTAIYPALLSGGELHLIGEDLVMDGKGMGDYCEREQIDLLKIVPSHLAGLRGVKGGERVIPTRVLVVGGEACPWKWVREWRAAGGCTVINHYGPTETTVGGVRFCVEKEMEAERGEETVPIGYPLGNVRVYVVDKDLEPTPAEVPGELYIGGAGVGRGYVNRADLTAERFVPDPFGAFGQRLYRSGDLVRRRMDGKIDFLGRIDQQVKIRGFRIELGEIEAVLREQAGVGQVAVVAVPDKNGEKQLVAYVTPARSAENGVAAAAIDVAALRAQLSLLLPDYMVPAAYVLLERLPVTRNGKLDRKALPSPDAGAYVTQDYEPPVGEVETTMARIWAEVLKLERVGRNDNFFELGGHSLLALTLIERMREAALRVDVRALFGAPTLKDLAAAAGGESDAVVAPPNLIPAGCTAITPAMLPLVSLSQSDIDKIVAGVPGGAGNVQDIYPLAPLQEGILFHHLLEKEGDVYLTATLLGAGSRESLDRYVEALQAVIERHDILRTAVMWEGLPEPVQVVWRHAPLKIEEVTLDSATGDISEQLRARFDPRHYRLDVRRAPLWRSFIAEDVPNHRWLMLDLTHHLMGDNTSGRFLLDEIEAILQGQAERLPEPLPFRNFVAQARLGVSREEHEAFFTRMLGDVDEPTAPFGLTDVQGDGSQIVEGSREVDADLTQRLRAQARALGVTAASLCHLAWALVLARTSGRDDVVFGTVLFGRMQGGEVADRGVGIFINTLPMRIQVGDDDVRTGVRKTHALLTQLFRHEHASLALAQRCSSVRAPAPLFTSLFNYRHGSKEAESEAKGINATQSWVGMEFLWGEGRTNFPFGMAVNDLEHELSLGVKVHGSIDPQRVCALMYTALRSLVEALESAPASRMRSLKALPEEERQQVVYEWNRTDAKYPMAAPVQGLFEQQVERTPALRAVVSQGEELTYQELNQRANQLGHYLRKQGVGPEERVGICMRRSVEMIVGLMGILKAGGAYLPLDPGYPEERLRYMVEDAGIRMVVTQQEVAEVLRGSGARLIYMDGEEEKARIAQESPRNPELTVAMENLLYVIYTSGSTGKAKGVGIEHRQLVNYVRGMLTEFQKRGMAEGAKYAMVSTLSADLGNTAIYPALLSGGELHVIGEDLVMDGKGMGEYCEREQIDLLKIVPSHLAGLRGVKGGERVIPTRVLVVGGEACPWKWVREWKTASGCTVINHYGPTETTVGGVRFCVEKEMEAEMGEETVPIGYPLGNVRVYVVDKEMEPVPVGVAGELYLGGAGVGRGYVNRADLTAERFVPDPFAGGGQRLYRSGDLVRRRKDGSIDFLGRIDQQVKIRGFRIELGEIEAVLREQAGVGQAAVIAAAGENGEKRLVAYVTAAGPAENGAAAAAIDVAALRAQLSSVLPDYMVPAAYVLLETLPVTRNGKLDRKALPSPDAGAYVTQGYEPPVGEVENTMARIWAEVLKLERVGRNDNFFELGGHSLLALTLVERMREAALTVDVRDLFGAPTLKDLAAAAGGESDAVVAPPNLIPVGCASITPAMLPLVSLSQSDIDKIVAGVPGGAGNVQDIYPLAPLQEGILFHHLLEKEGDVYLTATLLGAGSRESLDRYVEALQAVIERHDILRTAVMWEGLPEPVQVVWRHAPMSVEEVSLDPAAGDIAEQLRLRFDPRHYRLDVRRAPMWRLFIAEDLPNHRWVILELKHHLTGDNTSGKFLLSEIQAFLQGEAEHLPAVLPFRNFVAQARLGVSREEHEAFFTRMLGDVDEPTAPFGLTDVQGDGSQIVEGNRDVDADLTQRLRVQARTLGVTAASLCHLAWALVLARTSGRDDVVFGTVMFGRMQGGEVADRGVGIFINTLPVRIRVGDDDVRASARRTYDLLTQLFRHEHASLALVQRCSSVRAPAPLFTSLFNYRHVSQEAVSAEKGVNATQSWAGPEFLRGEGRTNYPFGIGVLDLGQKLNLEVQVNGAIDPQRVCALMNTALESLVTALERDPATPVCSLDVLPPAERHQLLVEWNAPGTEYPEDLCIHELFEAQAAQTPNAIAVAYEGKTLTYRELNRQANRLAHYLRGLGVSPDDRVAICAERSLEMMVGILAVLKAGGAYVPLDPAYPVERLEYMLGDSAPVVLLVHLSAALRIALSAVLTTGSIPVVDLQADARAWADGPEVDLNPENSGLKPQHLAYVIYTSGSTGKPKGVMVKHSNVVRLFSATRAWFHFDRNDVWTLFHSYAFDFSVWEIWGALLYGGKLLIVPQVTTRSPREFYSLLCAEGVTILNQTPSAFRQLMAAQAAEAGHRLRYVIFGGEALEVSTLRPWYEREPNRETRLINMYGITETTVHVTYCPLEEADTLTPGPSPIGRRIPDLTIYILDRHRQPAPIGVAGEMYVGGAGVARGYLNRPELTAERFIADPFSTDPHARLYKTGDLARFRPDGNIEYLGRNDHQVKIRGFRIELGEIEARLVEHPGVREAAVLAREDHPGDKRLVAYVTTARPAENGAGAPALDVEALREHLRSLLPEYMVPAAYVRLESLPLTANGKLDRKSLPSPDGDAYLTRGDEAPVGELETALAAIWADVLNLERIGRNDSFFEIGGHSLLAVQLVNRISGTLGVDMQLRDIFVANTIKDMATLLNALMGLNEMLVDEAASNSEERYL